MKEVTPSQGGTGSPYEEEDPTVAYRAALDALKSRKNKTSGRSHGWTGSAYAPRKRSGGSKKTPKWGSYGGQLVGSYSRKSSGQKRKW